MLSAALSAARRCFTASCSCSQQLAFNTSCSMPRVRPCSGFRQAAASCTCQLPCSAWLALMQLMSHPYDAPYSHQQTSASPQRVLCSCMSLLAVYFARLPAAAHSLDLELCLDEPTFLLASTHLQLGLLYR